MNFLNACIHNPVKVAVGVLLFCLFGVIALLRMPMQLTPEVETPTITVETRWPGASPLEVETEIVQEQEEQLKSVEGVTKMSSQAMDSKAEITLEFAVGTNMSEAMLKVNSRLQQVPEYPEDADQPVINTSNSSDSPIAWFILGERDPDPDAIEAFREKHPELGPQLDAIKRARSGTLALYRLRKFAKEYPALNELNPPPKELDKLLRFAEDHIEAKFERVDGVSNSNVIGGREEELQVVVDPEALAARQLTILDVRDALRSRNQDTSGGDFWEGKRRYVLRTLGQFNSPDDVENMIIARRDGRPVYVRDIATVRPDYKKPEGIVRRFGSTSLAINVVRETGANVLDIMTELRAVVDQLNEGLLKEQGLRLAQAYDETEYIHSSVELVQSNIIVGGLLTVAILLLFLRSGRSTLVIGLAIPISIIGTFLVLDLMGRSLNVISLAGLAFAIGMLVDNAVVVLENIYSHYQRGLSAFEASLKGAHEVWGAVVASTLTTLAVFLPVLFVQEEAGQLFRDIAIAISAAVGLSLVVSVIVIPTASPRILKRHKSDAANKRKDKNGNVVDRGWFGWLTRPLDAFGAQFVAVVVGINDYLQRGLIRRLVFAGAIVLGAVGVSYLILPKVEYLPNGNRNLVIGFLIPPPGYNLDQMLSMGQQVEGDLLKYWDIDPDDPAVAELDYPLIGDFFFVARGRQLFMGVRAEDPMRAKELEPLISGVIAKFPATYGRASQRSLFERGLTAGRSIDIEIQGPRLEKLVELALLGMKRVPGLIEGAVIIPEPNPDLISPEVHLTPRWEQAADLGISATDLGYTVDALVDGAYATDYYLGGDKIDLSIVGHDRFVRRTQDVGQLPVATPTGKLVSLSSIASIDPFATGPEQVNHREKQRAITLKVSPPDRMPLEEAQDLIQTGIVDAFRKEGLLGDEYQINLGGTADKLRSTWLALRFNVILALLITYLLMAALFESWLYPFVIIMTVPLGAVGGLGGLWLLNTLGAPFGVFQQLDVLTMLGFVILIGTVVNNPILIVHQSLNHMREDGMSPRASILESVRTRIRPIFMTTITTLLGLLPLVIFPGAGSELYRGLGAVLLGGLLVSTVFTLVLVPTLFSLMMDARAVVLRLVGSEYALEVGKGHHQEPAAPAVPRSPAEAETSPEWTAYLSPQETVAVPAAKPNAAHNGDGNGSAANASGGESHEEPAPGSRRLPAR